MMLSTMSLKAYLDVLPKLSAGPSNAVRAFAKHWKPHDHAAIHRQQVSSAPSSVSAQAYGENELTAETSGA